MNPEFQRNLWLQTSPRKLAWAGVSLALIYGAAVALGHDEPEQILPRLAMLGGVVFVVCAMLWGARASGNSVLAEIADRTWDFQRLSALDPWSMTWGKLFGGASLAWLCGLTGLLFVAAGMIVNDASPATTLVAMLATAVLFQGVSLGAALIGVRKARAEGRIARVGGVLGGLIVGAMLLSWVAGSAGFQHGAGSSSLSQIWQGRGFVSWGHGFYPADIFRAVCLTLFAGWAVVGAWRLMRLELQMQNAPVVWPAFLIFLAVFAGGFALRVGGVTAACTAGALVVALCAYAAAFAEPADRVRLRQFMAAVGKGDFARAAPLTPSPLAPVLISTLLVLAGFLTKGNHPAALDLDQAAALIAFLVRDLGVIALCRLGSRPQRGDMTAVVAIGLLYGVGGAVGLATAGTNGTALFVPISDAPMISLASGAVQAVLVWILAAGRIRGMKA